MKFNRNESIIPMKIDDGSVIYCDSISGGNDSTLGMPNQLGLVFRNSNGSEKRARYILCKSSIFEIEDQKKQLPIIV